MSQDTNYLGVAAIAFSLLLILFLYWLFFLDPQGDLLSEGDALWRLAYIAMGLLVYLWIQAAGALANPPGQLTVIAFLDISVSIIPAAVCWAAAFSAGDGAALPQMQQIVVALVTLTTVLDLLFFIVIIGGVQTVGPKRSARTR